MSGNTPATGSATADGQPPSYFRGPQHPPLLDLTIGAAFDRAVQLFADHPALVIAHQNVRWTYAQLRMHVNAFAYGLLGIGLRRGDRIGIWAPNRAEWVVTQYAAAKLGLILVNINPAYRLSELEYVLGNAGCKALVLADSFKGNDYARMLCELVPEIDGHPRGELRSSRLPQLKIAIQLGEHPRSGFFGFDAVIDLGRRVRPTDLTVAGAQVGCHDPANIQFTSGTTGSPKGTTLSQSNLLNGAYFIGRHSGLSETDRICVPLPLYHVFGMTAGNLAAMLFGAAVIYPGESFEPEAVLETVERERCTSLYGVPTMFIAELTHADFPSRNLTSLRTGIIAGAAVPTDVMRRVMTDMHMRDVIIGYGMTETSGGGMLTSPDDSAERRVETIGRATPHLEVKLVDATGATVPLGVTGEICVRGYSVMLGYWQDAARTAETIDPQGWLHSGDLATMDQDGYCRIVGRLREMVIRGGENIYPVEIEGFLHRHPKIESVQIVGVPDAKFGEELFAFIKTARGQELSEDEIRAFCKGQIAHYKIPRYIRFVAGFPVTATGKVQKYLLADEARRQLAPQQST